LREGKRNGRTKGRVRPATGSRLAYREYDCFAGLFRGPSALQAENGLIIPDLPSYPKVTMEQIKKLEEDDLL